LAAAWVLPCAWKNCKSDLSFKNRELSLKVGI